VEAIRTEAPWLDPPLLPTPVSNPDNPGAGGELRAAIQHGPERRNETGTDNWGRPNKGRTPKTLLPTPNANDGGSGKTHRQEGTRTKLQGRAREATGLDVSTGASTEPPSSDGPASSDGQLPLRPTSEDG
jgi:hypothetical protein